MASRRTSGSSPCAAARRRRARISSARGSVTSHAVSFPRGSAPGPPSMATLTARCSTSNPAGAYRGEFIAPTPSSVHRSAGPACATGLLVGQCPLPELAQVGGEHGGDVAGLLGNQGPQLADDRRGYLSGLVVRKLGAGGADAGHELGDGADASRGSDAARWREHGPNVG